MKIWKTLKGSDPRHDRPQADQDAHGPGRPKGRRRRPGPGRFEPLEDRVLLSHFRYGNLSNEPVAGTPNTQVFHFQFAAREESSSGGVDVKPGDIVTDDTGGGEFDFGDGNFASLPLRVLSVTPEYYLAEAGTLVGGVFTEGLVHTYGAPGDYTAGLNSAARISTLQNNADGSYNIKTIAAVGTANASPVSSIPPIVQVPDNQVFSFQVPAIDPDSDTLVYRLATSEEASGFSSGYTLPPNISINQTGLVTWDVTNGATNTVAGDLWTAQVIVEDHDALTGALKSQIPLDFLLQIVSPTTQPPVFDFAPGGVLTPVAGQTLTFVVQASDPTPGNTVSLQALNPPSGMTFASVAPAPGSRPNAVAIEASFTPTAQQAGQTFVISFQATNSQNLTAVTQVTISPTASPAPTIVSGQVNDGAVQRSRVQSLRFTFNKVVTVDPGAFILTLPSGAQPVTLGAATSTVNGVTVADLTFSGAGIVAGSLQDGRYTLTILGDHVHDSLGQTLNGGDYAFKFFRLFGDANGNGAVDNSDAYVFKQAYTKSAGQAGYLAYLDYNNDGVIDATDLAQYRLRYGKKI